MTPHGVTALGVTALVRGWRLPEVVGGWLAILVATWAAPRLVDLPNLQEGMHVATPFASFAAAACAVVVLLTAGEPCPAIFGSAPRRARVTNLSRVVIVMILGPAVVASAGSARLAPLLSSSLALTGEGLVFAAIGAGLRLAWLLPLGHLLVAAVAGPDGLGSLRSWAWILDQNPSPSQFLLSALVAGVGLSAWTLVVSWRAPLLAI